MIPIVKHLSYLALVWLWRFNIVKLERLRTIVNAISPPSASESVAGSAAGCMHARSRLPLLPIKASEFLEHLSACCFHGVEPGGCLGDLIPEEGAVIVTLHSAPAHTLRMSHGRKQHVPHPDELRLPQRVYPCTQPCQQVSDLPCQAASVRVP